MTLKKVLIKLSGEGIGNKNTPYDFAVIYTLVKQLIKLQEDNYQISIVIGGGNIFRGSQAKQIYQYQNVESQNPKFRNKLDYVGMYATIVNAFLFKNMLEISGGKVSIFNNLNHNFIKKNMNESEIEESIKNNEIILFSGGTGKPGVTTDTLTANIALQLDVDLILVLKSGVLGVYTSDPKKNRDSNFLSRTTLKYLIENKLEIFDQTFCDILLGHNKLIYVSMLDMNVNLDKLIKGGNVKKTIIEDK